MCFRDAAFKRALLLVISSSFSQSFLGMLDGTKRMALVRTTHKFPFFGTAADGSWRRWLQDLGSVGLWQDCLALYLDICTALGWSGWTGWAG
jgi:hypothetical protein